MALKSWVRYWKTRVDSSLRVVTRGFIRRKVSNYCLYLGSFEAVERGFLLERGFQQ
jgi:hypothetical protein